MKHIRALLLCLLALPAFGQTRVFVSAGLGDDVNPCTLASPCRSFAKAVSVVASNGEVLALDSGGYGPVSISKPLSLVAPPGVEASVTATSGDAIDVNVPTAFTVVILRGLSLFGLGAGTHGINTNNTFMLLIDACTISGFSQNGINMTAGSLSTLTMTNSTIVGNGNAGLAASGTIGSYAARFDIDRTVFESNASYGIYATNGSRGTVHDCQIRGSSSGGISVILSAAFIVNVQIDHCRLNRNNVGIGAATNGAGGTVEVRVSNSLITGNTTGVHSSDAGAHIDSRGDNTLIDNNTDGAFTGTYAAQ